MPNIGLLSFVKNAVDVMQSLLYNDKQSPSVLLWPQLTIILPSSDIWHTTIQSFYHIHS